MRKTLIVSGAGGAARLECYMDIDAPGALEEIKKGVVVPKASSVRIIPIAGDVFKFDHHRNERLMYKRERQEGETRREGDRYLVKYEDGREVSFPEHKCNIVKMPTHHIALYPKAPFEALLLCQLEGRATLQTTVLMQEVSTTGDEMRLSALLTSTFAFDSEYPVDRVLVRRTPDGVGPSPAPRSMMYAMAESISGGAEPTLAAQTELPVTRLGRRPVVLTSQRLRGEFEVYANAAYGMTPQMFLVDGLPSTEVPPSRLSVVMGGAVMSESTLHEGFDPRDAEVFPLGELSGIQNKSSSKRDMRGKTTGYQVRLASLLDFDVVVTVYGEGAIHPEQQAPPGVILGQNERLGRPPKGLPTYDLAPTHWSGRVVLPARAATAFGVRIVEV